MATWGSADYRQLERLRENLAKLQGADMDKFCTDVSRELAWRLLALVIPRTPVGRKPTLEQLGGKEAKATVKTKLRDAQGRLRTRSFLSREGAILQQYWSGYMGGTLRRGWTAKNEEAAAKPGGGMTAKAYAQTLPVTKAGGVYQITVINPVKYASYVEFGHRQKPGRYVPQIGKRLKRGWVPGKYMLTLSEKDLQTIAPGLLEKRLDAFLREVFNGTN